VADTAQCRHDPVGQGRDDGGTGTFRCHGATAGTSCLVHSCPRSRAATRSRSRDTPTTPDRTRSQAWRARGDESDEALAAAPTPVNGPPSRSSRPPLGPGHALPAGDRPPEDASTPPRRRSSPVTRGLHRYAGRGPSRDMALQGGAQRRARRVAAPGSAGPSRERRTERTVGSGAVGGTGGILGPVESVVPPTRVDAAWPGSPRVPGGRSCPATLRSGLREIDEVLDVPIGTVFPHRTGPAGRAPSQFQEPRDPYETASR